MKKRKKNPRNLKNQKKKLSKKRRKFQRKGNSHGLYEKISQKKEIFLR